MQSFRMFMLKYAAIKYIIFRVTSISILQRRRQLAMTMQYFLRPITSGDLPKLTIDSQRFSLLRTSTNILAEALQIEEEYEMIISNYIDLEKEALNTSISYMVRTPLANLDTFEARLAMNRRLMNLLTAVRLYTDRLTAHCSACLPQETGIKERVQLLRSTEHQKNFHYRFMEAFRNYIQHRGTAVHQVILGGSGSASGTDRLLEFSSSFSAYKQVLASDNRFNQHVLDEMPDGVDLVSASRGYLEALSSIHNNVRQMTSGSVNEARALLQKAIDQYKSACRQEFWGLNAYVFDGKTKIDEIPISLTRDDIRLQLHKRNNRLSHLKKSYVTARTKKR